MRTKITDFILGAVIVGAAFCAPSIASAGTITVLPVAIWSGTVTTGACASSIGLCGLGQQNITGPGDTGSSPVEVIGKTSPSIIATAAVPAITSADFPIDSRSAHAGAQLLYNLEVMCTGLTCPVTVPIGGTGVAFVTSLGANASSKVKLSIGTITILNVLSTNGTATGLPTGAVSSGFIYSSGTLNLVPNFIYTVSMEADADAATASGAQSASAFIDPFFFIIPGFPDAGQYSIITSPGIDNISAVPEPSSWMMLLTGLAGLGFFMYRGPKKCSTAVPWGARL